MPDGDADASAAALCTDACGADQTALVQQFVLDKRAELDALAGRGDSAAGPRSICPFVPTAASRVPYIWRAARLSPSDVLWDLGCGDGRLLHDASERYGCRCVGLDIDARCVEVAQRLARERGVADLCSFALADLTALPAGALASHSAAAEAVGDEAALAPTVVVTYLTASALVRISPWLFDEWRGSPHGLRIVTCCDSLDNVVDFSDPCALFADGNELGWLVSRAHERWGVFVVPPRCQTVEAWDAAAEPDEASPNCMSALEGSAVGQPPLEN